jgi:hypothetical protein
MADQYLHPVVHNWTALEWIRAAEDGGFVLDAFVFDPTPHGMCIPKDALNAVQDPKVRDVLAGLKPREQYAALELIFRPAMHVISFNTASKGVEPSHLVGGPAYR